MRAAGRPDRSGAPAPQLPEKAIEDIRAETIREREAWYKAAHWSLEARQELGAERAAAAEPRRPRLIALDEASMVDSRSLSELLRRAEAFGDKVVLVGDRNQALDRIQQPRRACKRGHGT